MLVCGQSWSLVKIYRSLALILKQKWQWLVFGLYKLILWCMVYGDTDRRLLLLGIVLGQHRAFMSLMIAKTLKDRAA